MPEGSLVVSLDRHLTGLPLLLSGSTSSNRWQLDSKTKKALSLSPGQDTLTNN